MVSNYFVDDSLFSVYTNQKSVSIVKDCLALFYEALAEIFSDHKMDYWQVDLEDWPTWFPTTWRFSQLGVTMQYLGIPFGWAFHWFLFGIGP
jgi:hypothetical protein